MNDNQEKNLEKNIYGNPVTFTLFTGGFERFQNRTMCINRTTTN